MSIRFATGFVVCCVASFAAGWFLPLPSEDDESPVRGSRPPAVAGRRRPELATMPSLGDRWREGLGAVPHEVSPEVIATQARLPVEVERAAAGDREILAASVIPEGRHGELLADLERQDSLPDASPMHVVLHAPEFNPRALVAGLRSARTDVARTALRIAVLRTLTPETLRALLDEVVRGPPTEVEAIVSILQAASLDAGSLRRIVSEAPISLVRSCVVEGTLQGCADPETAEALLEAAGARLLSAPADAGILFLAMHRVAHLRAVLSRQLHYRDRILHLVSAASPEAREEVRRAVRGSADLREAYPSLAR